jgi:hypothetical protein
MVASVALAAALTSPTPAAVAQTPPSPALLEELAERLLQPPYAGPTGETPRIRLLPGALPPGLPLEIPMPPGGRLVGSAVRSGLSRPPGVAVEAAALGSPGTATRQIMAEGSGDGQADSVDIVIDAPGSTDDVVAFYEQVLGEQGWSVPGTYGQPRPSGFQSTRTTLNRVFCQTQGGGFLSLLVFTMASGTSDVRINVNPSGPGQGYGPCSTLATAGSPPEPPGAGVIPVLYAPAGTQILSSGGGARPGPGPSLLMSEAVAESSLSVAELEASFADQLTAAGWTRQAGAATGPLAWSVWTVPGDGAYQGFLYVLDVPGGGRRSLHVEVASGDALPFFGGK